MSATLTGVPAGAAARAVQLTLLTAAVAAAMYARTALSPLQEMLRISYGLSDNQMALLQGPALALPLVIATVPVGLLIDRYSRVRLIAVFGLLSLVGTLLTAFAENFVVLFASRCLVGLSATATGTAAFSLISDLFLPAERGRATLTLAVGQFGGTSAAFALGGAILTAMGTGPDNLRSTLLWWSVPLGIVCMSMLAMREPLRMEVRSRNPSVCEAFLEFWRYRFVVGPLVGGLVMLEVAFQSAMVWTAPALARNYMLGPQRVGAIMATGLMVSGILGPVVGGILADLSQRAGGPRCTMGLLTTLTLLALPTCWFTAVPSIRVASVLLFTFMATACALLVMGTALLTIVVPNELRGLCMASFTSATLIFGVGLGPMGVSWLSGALGGNALIGRALLLVAVVTGALAAAMFAHGRAHTNEMKS